MNHSVEQPSDRELLLRKIDRRDKIGRAFGLTVLAIVVFINIFAIFISTDNSTKNRARIDVNLCIVSVPPQTRTPTYVHTCYDNAEKDDGVTIQRFGYGQ